jgi:hypothetical protein
MIAWTIYLTFAGSLAVLFLPRGFSRWLALLTTVGGEKASHYRARNHR